MPTAQVKKNSTNKKSDRARTLSIEAARRVVLAAQGFATYQPSHNSSKNSKPGFDNAPWRVQQTMLRRMSALQIDAINTVIRSHYMPLFSRLGHYSRDELDKHLFDAAQQRPSRRKFFEYWGHECSVMPIDHYHLLHWRMQDAQRYLGVYKQCAQIAKSRPGFLREIRTTLANNGPLALRDLEKSGRGPGMWEWSDTKQALEYLFWSGEITTRGRTGFQRRYELTENAIPQSELLKCSISRDDAQADLIVKSIAALGLGTEADIRDYYRLSAVDAKRVVTRLLEDKRIEAVNVEGWDKCAYWLPGTRVPRQTQHSCLLTPFDPLVWYRQRLRRLFNFDYTIEIYVPAAKRQYGYYVLPFLHNEEIVARVDLKADRQKGCLRVLGIWWENKAAANAKKALSNELHRLCDWLDLNEVSNESKSVAMATS